MFKDSNKDNRTTSLAFFWCLYCELWTYFTPCSNCSIVNFKHLIAVWLVLFYLWSTLSIYWLRCCGHADCFYLLVFSQIVFIYLIFCRLFFLIRNSPMIFSSSKTSFYRGGTEYVKSQSIWFFNKKSPDYSLLPKLRKSFFG